MDPDYPSGLDPYAARQRLLHHTYSPLISIQASHNADLYIQRALDNKNISFLQFIKPYGNNAAYTTSGQTFKITNTQLITKLYPSFPIRFELSLPDLLSIMTAREATGGGAAKPEAKLHQLFSISSLEVLLKHKAGQSVNIVGEGGADGGQEPPTETETDTGTALEPTQTGYADKTTEPESAPDLYLELFTKVITSNRIVPFETFNHPVSQIFAVDFHTDTVDDLRKLIVEFRNYNFPKYFQIDDLLIHVFVLHDVDADAKLVAEYQNGVRKLLSVQCTAVPIAHQQPRSSVVTSSTSAEGETGTSGAAEADAPGATVTNTNATIEEELQRITLKQPNTPLRVPLSLDATIRKRLHEYINKHLIPHMERKIRVWDDLVLAPKKSITGRFFSVSKIFFNNNSGNSGLDHSLGGSTLSTSFNFQENYYHKSSPEQIIRKLADWSLFLKDFKYAYSTYDVIKKDYTNDKAWVYVAAAQEICIASLLLAQTQQGLQLLALASGAELFANSGVGSNPGVSGGTAASGSSGVTAAAAVASAPPDRNTFRKIRHDIIEPYCDNLLYTLKLRFSLRSYAIKALLIFVELLLCLLIHHGNAWWWNDLIENYLYKCIDDFERHFVNGGQVIRALLYERLGYAFGRCTYLDGGESLRWASAQRRLGGGADTNTKLKLSETEDGLYKNPNKLDNRALHFAGLTKYRKLSLWYLLLVREWLELKNFTQVAALLENIRFSYNIKEITPEWYDRNDLLLGFTKRALMESKEAEPTAA